MKKILTVSVVIFLICILIFACASHFTYAYKTAFLLDTNVSVKAKGIFAKKAVEECILMADKIEKKLSAYISSSEISMLNKSGSFSVSDETKKIIQDAVFVSQKTEGGFDITIKPIVDLYDIKNMSNKNDIPTDEDILSALKKVDYKNIEIDKNKISLKNGAQIDLGGIAKGYCADEAQKIMQKYNIKEAILDFGGNIYVLGNRSFKIGIQNPSKPRGEYFGIFEGKNISVVTSGAYERYKEIDGKIFHHIINPKTGYPAENGITSVSIVGKSSKKCDAFATAVYVLGIEKGLEIVNSESDIECIITDKSNKVYLSDNIEFKITDDNFERGN